MGIRFDAEIAEQLLSQMDFYCLSIVKETQALRDILKDSDIWDDNQKKAFQNNIEALALDLNQALHLESDYMQIFAQRISEIRR